MNDGYVEMWDSWAKKRSSLPVYDLWLDEYKDILEKNKDSEILDLGCGNGANTLYLSERGYNVLSCDFSKEALANIEKYIPNTKTMYLDMRNTFPIEDNKYSLVIADLCLHYFDNETTIRIMNEIKRILKDGGILLARVATVNDYNFGAGQGRMLEENYYLTDDNDGTGGYAKRFFTLDDVNRYFGIIGKVEAKETSMLRDEEEYSKPKVLYQIKVEKD